MLDDLVTPLVVVIDLADQALAEPPGEVDKFLQRSDRYLKALELWRLEIGAAGDGGLEKHPQRDQLMALIEKLNTRHAEVVRRSQELKDEVAHELSAMRKRASALKAYIDRFPKRVTITGKRQG